MASFITRGGNPLLIPELLQCILDFLPTGTSSDRECLRTLAALARTCRDISEPSLNRIWRKLDTLYRFIRFLRPEVWAQDQCTDDYELVEMTPPTPAEWDVIKRHSFRVRELDICYEHLSLSFLKSLGSHPAILFPNLKVLRWWQADMPYLCASIALIYPLLSPSLVELHVDLAEEGSEPLKSFLRSYPLQCPNLRTISFSYFEGEDRAPISEATTRELSRSVCNHEKLAHLSVTWTSIDDAALKELSMSPTLEFLSLEFAPRKPIPRPYFHPEDKPFRYVREFHISTSDLDLVTTLLGPCDQMFQTCHIYTDDQPTAITLSTFLSMLASSSTYPESIRHLSLGFGSPDIPSSDEEPDPPTEAELTLFCLSYRSFLPLMSFSHLRKLWIYWKHQISLDDNELANMARSWPSMQSLRLDCSRGVYPPSLTKYVTLKGLLILIDSCPDLKELHFPLDAREVPMDTDPNITNTAISDLCFSESPIDEADAVATFLFTHFPSVERVYASFSHLGAPHSSAWRYNKTWNDVNKCLWEFRMLSWA